MIEYIIGKVTELTPTYAVVECGGIGYMLNITLSAFSELENQRTDIRMLVHESIREDAHQLFGFTNETERSMFRLLIGVSGVGAGTARMILSAIPAPELQTVIAAGDHRRLTAAKGIGAKTAQRIIVDLRDKIKPVDDTLINQPASAPQEFEEALAALVMLGFAKPQSQKVLKKIFDADPTVKLEVAIKRALAMM